MKINLSFIQFERLTISLVEEIVTNGSMTETAKGIRFQMREPFDSLSEDERAKFNPLTIALYELNGKARNDLERANAEGMPTIVEIRRSLREKSYFETIDLITRAEKGTFKEKPYIKWEYLASCLEALGFDLSAGLFFKRALHEIKKFGKGFVTVKEISAAQAKIANFNKLLSTKKSTKQLEHGKLGLKLSRELKSPLNPMGFSGKVSSKRNDSGASRSKKLISQTRHPKKAPKLSRDGVRRPSMARKK